MIYLDTLVLTEFAKILLFIIAGFLFVGIGYFANYLLSPNRPNEEKNATYECGEEAISGSGLQFNMRFYVIGLIFLIFEVEVLFLFPWATVYADPGFIQAFPSWGVFALVEASIFLLVLVLGLAYVWKKGDLNWVKPMYEAPQVETGIPDHVYDRVNKKYA